MPIFFHIGYPKAASTMLQKHLFAQHPELINLGLYPSSNIGIDQIIVPEKNNVKKPPFLFDDRIKSLYISLTQTSGLEFNCAMTKINWQDIASDYLDSHRSNDSVSKIILSHESVTSCRFSHPEILEKARRIQAVFGKIKIIIIIRNHLAMLKSLYRDHPFDPRTLEYKPRSVSFREWIQIDVQRGPLSLVKSLYFGKATAVFESLFGNNNVLVVPMEMLRTDLQYFSSQISGFLDIDHDLTYSLLDNPPINTGVSYYGRKYRTLRAELAPFANSLGFSRNHLQEVDKKMFKFLKKFGPDDHIALDSENEEILKKLFSEDNASLASRKRLPLRELGYYL